MNRRAKNLGLSFALGLVMVLAFQASAQAITWPKVGVISASYDSLVRATAKGNFYNDAGTYAHDAFTLNDTAHDSNSVYGINQIGFDAGSGTGPKSTGLYNDSNSPVTIHFKRPLAAAGTRAYGDDKVCVDLGFPISDRCSDTSMVSFGY